MKHIRHVLFSSVKEFTFFLLAQAVVSASSNLVEYAVYLVLFSLLAGVIVPV